MRVLSKGDSLQEKLARMHEVRESRRLREAYGQIFVDAINSATGKSLSLDDYDSHIVGPISISWTKDVADTEGLVAAYVSRLAVESILMCIRGRLGNLDGLIGFHGKSYLGLAHANQVDPISLLVAAESTMDSVVFHNDLPSGVIMVDCYVSQPGNPYSIVVQGDNLVSELQECFASERQS